MREEYVKDISATLESSNEVIVEIQKQEEFVTAFKKFYNTFDVNDEMLILYFIKQDENDANNYEYSLSDIQYGEGYLDINLTKKLRESLSQDAFDNVTFLVVRLPQLPAYNITINKNE